MLAVMFELAKRVAERSPPVKSTSTASALAMFITLSVMALTSSREYIGGQRLSRWIERRAPCAEALRSITMRRRMLSEPLHSEADSAAAISTHESVHEPYAGPTCRSPGVSVCGRAAGARRRRRRRSRRTTARAAVGLRVRRRRRPSRAATAAWRDCRPGSRGTPACAHRSRTSRTPGRSHGTGIRRGACMIVDRGSGLESRSAGSGRSRIPRPN